MPPVGLIQGIVLEINAAQQQSLSLFPRSGRKIFRYVAGLVEEKLLNQLSRQ